MPGATYVLRPGGYVVIFRSGGKVAVVSTPKGLFLPGGGQVPGESPEDAAIREAKEEYGLNVSLGRIIGVADELVFDAEEATHYRKRNRSRREGDESRAISKLWPRSAARQVLANASVDQTGAHNDEGHGIRPCSAARSSSRAKGIPRVRLWRPRTRHSFPILRTLRRTGDVNRSA
jgi:8-oxo-dGTP pyrophosphatase MutT (NUDIX family)